MCLWSSEVQVPSTPDAQVCTCISDLVRYRDDVFGQFEVSLTLGYVTILHREVRAWSDSHDVG